MSAPIPALGPSGPTEPRFARRERLVATLVIVIALLIGILVGIVADRRLLAPHHRWLEFRGWRGDIGAPTWRGSRMAPGAFGRGGSPPEGARRWLAHELGLSPAQAARVDSIMTQRMREHQALADSMRARWRAGLDSTRADIRRVLTPEQQKKLDSLRSRHDRARMRGDGPELPAGPGGPDRGGAPPGGPGAPPPRQ